MSDPQIGTFTSEEFLNKYVRTTEQSASKTQISSDCPSPILQQLRSEADLSLNDYSASLVASANKGHFTTALNAPRIIPMNIDQQREEADAVVSKTATKKYFEQSSLQQHGASAGYSSTAVRSSSRQSHGRGPTQYSPSKQYFTAVTEIVTVSRNGSSNANQYSNVQEIVYQNPVSVNSQVHRTYSVEQQLPQLPVRPSSQHSSQVVYTQQPQQVVQTVVPPSTVIRTSQASEGEPIKGHSRIEYVPFQNKIIDYQTREWIERVPVQKTITEYEERRTIEQVPREVSRIDYYPVEHITEYVPHVVEETVVEMVPVEKTVLTTQYVPVETQIVHRSDGTKVQGQSRILYEQPVCLVDGVVAPVQGQSRVKYQTTETTSVQGQSRTLIGSAVVQPSGQSRVVVAPSATQGQSQVVIVQPTVSMPSPTEVTIVEPIQTISIAPQEYVVSQSSTPGTVLQQSYFPPPMAASQVSVVTRNEQPVQIVQGGMVQMGHPISYSPPTIHPAYTTTIYQPQSADQVYLTQEQIYRSIQQSAPPHVIYTGRVPAHHVVYQTAQPIIIERPAYHINGAVQSPVLVNAPTVYAPPPVRSQSPQNIRYANAAQRYIAGLEQQYKPI